MTLEEFVDCAIKASVATFNDMNFVPPFVILHHPDRGEQMCGLMDVSESIFTDVLPHLVERFEPTMVVVVLMLHTKAPRNLVAISGFSKTQIDTRLAKVVEFGNERSLLGPFELDNVEAPDGIPYCLRPLYDTLVSI